MARLVSLVCLALVGQALCTPTPPTVPHKYFGTYESVPESDQNVAEFFSVFPLPPNVDFSRPTIFYFYKDNDYYVDRLVLGPGIPPLEFRYKFGEPGTFNMNGRTLEYVVTLETGGETPVVKAKFRCTETDRKFTVEITPTPNGFTATYTREGVTARRTYIRAGNPAYAGFYVNIPEKQSPNFLEFAQRVFPAPKGVTYDSNTAVYLGRWGRDYVFKYFLTPSISVKFPFRWDETRTITLNGKPVTYKYTIVEETFTPRSFTARGEFTTEAGTMTITAVVTPEGVSATYKAGEETASRYYKRVINALAFGTYEHVPQYAENWPEFARTVGKEDDSTQKTRVNIYREGPSNYFKVHYENGKEFTLPFLLNKQYETTLPKGEPVKYTFTERTSYSSDALIRSTFDYNGKSVVADMTFNATGVYVQYKSGSVTARRYYRRVFPAKFLGKYKSNPDTPEFAQFAQTIGSPELLKPTTVEFREGPNYKLYQTISVEGVSPVEFPFYFGKQYDTTVKNTPMKYMYYFFEYPSPVLHTYFFEANKGPKTFSVAAEFTPTGYTATYTYGGRLATRTYTRV